jgi:hypothetical protein
VLDNAPQRAAERGHAERPGVRETERKQKGIVAPPRKKTKKPKNQKSKKNKKKKEKNGVRGPRCVERPVALLRERR